MTKVTVIIQHADGKWMMAELEADVDISEDFPQSSVYDLGRGRVHVNPTYLSMDIRGRTIGPLAYSDIPFSKPTPGAGRLCGVINPRTGMVCQLMDHFPNVVRNEDPRDVIHKTMTEDGQDWYDWKVGE